jgi:hypothetical protein
VFEDDWAVSDVSGRATGPDWFKIGIAILVLVVIGILAYVKKKSRF